MIQYIFIKMFNGKNKKPMNWKKIYINNNLHIISNLNLFFKEKVNKIMKIIMGNKALKKLIML